MTRDILCSTCATDRRELFPNDNPYPGEYIKFVPGYALEDYFCDLCGGAIETKQACTAYSIWTNRRPYTAWESEYIKLKEDQ